MIIDNYKAIILAGGKGTRLYPITKEIPKPLLPINKKPIINYLVDLFIQYGVKEIAVLISKDFKEDFDWWKKRYYPSAGSSAEAHPKSLGQAPNIKLVEEEEPLGTFGGLYLLKDWIGSSKFFLTNGDELKDIDLARMADFHSNIDALATIALVQVDDPHNYGVVICNNGKVEEFLEKPKNPVSKYINSGIYLLDSKILDYSKKEFLMTEKDIFPMLAEQKKLAGFKFDGSWTDCGTWERYEQAIFNWKKT